MKAPKCCKKFMELKAVTYTTYTQLIKFSYIYFQCKKCGEVKETRG